MLDISRAFANDHTDTTNILNIKLMAPLALRRFIIANMPRNSDTEAEAINGHMYGIY